MTVVAVAGTWAWQSAWWQDGSPFWRYMEAHGVYPARINGLPFRWSTDLGNSWKFWQTRRSQWEAGGDALAYYLDALPAQHRVVLAHSHGGQVVAHAAAMGVEIDRVVTIATPYRADMEVTYAKARASIRRWAHVLDSDGDNTAWWGAFGDRRVGNVRHFTQADANIKIAGIGHSGLLSDPKHFHWWTCAGIIDHLKGV